MDIVELTALGAVPLASVALPLEDRQPANDNGPRNPADVLHAIG